MIGIAIINYNTYSKTIECISSIRETTKEKFKIYLLENGSKNESADILSSTYANAHDVKLIISSENHGYARGNNICIQAMRKDGCEYGIISNNDIICESGSVDQLLLDIKKHTDYLLIGPMICDPSGKVQKSIKLHKYSPVEYLLKSTYLSYFIRKKLECEYRQICSIKSFQEASWVSGAFFVFDISKFYKIGDFDPKTFLFFEEYILSAKAQVSGYKIGYEPNARVFHYHGASTGGGQNVISKSEADRSEKYYFTNYNKQNTIFLFFLKVIRTLEVVYTFGKQRDVQSIKKYLRRVREPL